MRYQILFAMVAVLLAVMVLPMAVLAAPPSGAPQPISPADRVGIIQIGVDGNTQGRTKSTRGAPGTNAGTNGCALTGGPRKRSGTVPRKAAAPQASPQAPPTPQTGSAGANQLSQPSDVVGLAAVPDLEDGMNIALQAGDEADRSGADAQQAITQAVLPRLNRGMELERKAVLADPTLLSSDLDNNPVDVDQATDEAFNNALQSVIGNLQLPGIRLLLPGTQRAGVRAASQRGQAAQAGCGGCKESPSNANGLRLIFECKDRQSATQLRAGAIMAQIAQLEEELCGIDPGALAPGVCGEEANGPSTGPANQRQRPALPGAPVSSRGPGVTPRPTDPQNSPLPPGEPAPQLPPPPGAPGSASPPQGAPLAQPPT
ncbi:MAG: hypothetical protein ACREN8_06905, partial [Candidatus Dormibacteraceae bacterium]